ncbi:uncharacterized protein [Penaeus vannamei]|uniref:uncharacterized protein n=1 Tax=Penaeus vannamei TaxID=6689 RepID=UPI00387F4252
MPMRMWLNFLAALPASLYHIQQCGSERWYQEQKSSIFGTFQSPRKEAFLAVGNSSRTMDTDKDLIAITAKYCTGYPTQYKNLAEDSCPTQMQTSSLRTSLGAYTAIGDMKPKASFSLNTIIHSSTGVTSTTEGWSLLEVAIATP